MNDDYWYNIKNEEGKVTVEKKSKKAKEESISKEKESNDLPVVTEKTKKKNWTPVFILLPILVILPLIILFLLNIQDDGIVHEKKHRTIMLYMVGSDLESSGSMGTFDLNDINGQKIDLDNNNVVLMVGGSKKWHNFVNEKEIGLYELSKSGFKKIKSYDVSSMGSVNIFSKFLDYAHDKFPADKYDLIFWNHGLGAAGLEEDELSNDFLDINEMDKVFKQSPFSKDKLELIIFNNCLAGNIHFASIMKNYAEYMVGSEEVLYVGSIINRLDFLNDVKVSDDGYDIGLLYVNKSDASVSAVNRSGKGPIDSTLSIIDLSMIDKVETNMNIFFNSLDLDKDYRAISRTRRRINTYGAGEYEYDTVDLYDLATSLSNYSNSKAIESLKSSIKDAVKYNSALNSYSNGLSVYFPYYGSTEYIESHLYLFQKLWKNDYTEFINNYYNKSNSTKRARRSGNENVLYLSNEIKNENNNISLELTNEEKESFQKANIYIFKENDNNKYELVLKSDELELNDNKLVFDKNKVLKDINNKAVSSIYENGSYKVYGKLNDTNVVLKISNNNGFGTINSVLIDSDDKPIGGFVEYNKENINYYTLTYSLLTNEKLDEDWKENKEKVIVNNDKVDLNIVSIDLKDYYVLIEVNDENNDSFYTQLTKIK